MRFEYQKINKLQKLDYHLLQHTVIKHRLNLNCCFPKNFLIIL